MQMNNKIKSVILLLILTSLPLTLFGTVIYVKDNDIRMRTIPNSESLKSELDKLYADYKKAREENKQAQKIKALCRIILYEGMNQENVPESFINRFEKAIEDADEDIKPILKVILAKWVLDYHEYEDRMQKDPDYEKISKLNENNNWDTARIYEYIDKLYESVLENEKELSNKKLTKNSDYYEFLYDDNNIVDLKDNLYEVFIHEALDFYNHVRECNEKTQIGFNLDDNSKIFGTVDEFINWKPEISDPSSCNYKSLKLYQKLLSINKKNNNVKALIHNDYKRIRWAYEVSYGLAKKQKFISALEHLYSKYKDNSLISGILNYLSDYYYENGDYVKTLEYCKIITEKWPSSSIDENAKKLISKIEKPEISCTAEKFISSKTRKIKINFKNLNHIYFRLIKIKDNRINNYDAKEIRVDFVKNLLSINPDYTFDSELEPTSDYKTHSASIDIPELEKGFYWIIASDNKNFDINSDCAILIDSIIVSDLAVISRNINSDRLNQIFVLDSVTGKPIEGAELKIYQYFNNEFILKKSGKTNKDGVAFFQKCFDKYFLLCSYKDDKIYTELQWKDNYYGFPNELSSDLIFTDKEIYKTGQEVFFNIVSAYRNIPSNEYRVEKNKKITVTIFDFLYKTVKSKAFITNKFGTAAGSITIPKGSPSGEYFIKCGFDRKKITVVDSDDYQFHIVSLDKPEKNYTLGQEVKLKGRVNSSTGKKIVDTKVDYKIIRTVKFPYWCWWVKDVKDIEEIVHGNTKTDDNGEFEIRFLAKPNYTINELNYPIFTYTLTAEIKNINGATHSVKQDINIGYTETELSIDAQEQFNADKELEYSIISKSLNGEKMPVNGHVRIYSLIQPDNILDFSNSLNNDDYSPEISSLIKDIEVSNGKNDTSKYVNIIPVKTNKYIYKDIETKETDISSAIKKLKEDKLVYFEQFSTDNEGICKKAIKLPEGIYRIKVESKDRNGKIAKAENNVIALSYSSDKMSIKLPFIFEVISKNLKPGDNLQAFWATGYEQGPAYIEIFHKDKSIHSYWTGFERNKHFISFPITEELLGGFWVKVFQIKDNQYYSVNKYINIDWQNKNLNLKFVHFNSMMQPIARERWAIEVSGEEAEKNNIELFATMYDTSLDAFAPNSWDKFNIFYKDKNNIKNTFSNYSFTLNAWKDFENYYERPYRRPGFGSSLGIPNAVLPDYGQILHKNYQRKQYSQVRLKQQCYPSRQMMEE